MTKPEKAVLKLHEYIKNKKLLEIACGSAEFSVSAADLAASVHCIDSDPHRIMPEVIEHENITVRKMNASDLLFPDDSFDTVVMYNAVARLAGEMEKAVAEAMRVGGDTVLISSLNTDKYVIFDELLPMLERERIPFCLMMDGEFAGVVLRRHK